MLRRIFITCTVFAPIAIGRVLVCALLAGGANGATHAQDYPGRPIRIVVPYPPGGNTDVLARTLGQKFTESWAQQTPIDNRPGAAGNIGMELAARAAPDGYTLVMMNNTQTINPAIYAKLPFDLMRDFAPVSLAGVTSMLLAVHPSLPVKSVNGLIALARAQPGKLSYGSCGNGTPHHLAAELFKVAARVDMLHVPYKGCAPALTDALGGQIPVVFISTTSVVSHVNNARLRGLAITTARRSPGLPGLPTMAEAGLRGYDIGIWNAMLAPAGTPPAIIAKLNAEIVRALALPEIRDKLLSQDIDPRSSTPGELTALMHADLGKYVSIVKQARIHIE